MFDPLLDGKNPQAYVSVQQYQTPEFFNVSAANNLGLYKSRGRYLMFANADIIYPGSFFRRAMFELTEHHISYAVAARCNMTQPQTQNIHAKSPLNTQPPTASGISPAWSGSRTPAIGSPCRPG